MCKCNSNIQLKLNSKREMEVRINLKNRPTEPVNVKSQWKFDVIKPKPGLFKKFTRVEKDVKISISNLKIDEDIICKKNLLFSVLYEGEPHSQKDLPLSTTLSKMSTPFQLSFNQQNIIDCRRRQDGNTRSYPISLNVDLRDSDDNLIDTEEVKIDVVFEQLDIKPTVLIDMENDSIQYSSSLQREHIGDFVAYIKEDFNFTPEQIASVSLKLFRGNQEIPGAISFENNENKIENIRIKAGKENLIKIPVYVDFCGIANPITEKEDFCIEYKTIISPEYAKGVTTTNIENIHFSLLQDAQGSELKVFVKDDETLTEYTGVYSLPFSFTPKSNIGREISLVLRNLANDDSRPNAGIHIKNMTVSEHIVGDVHVVGMSADKKEILLSNLVAISGRDVEAMKSPEGLFISNGMNAETILSIIFDPREVVDLINAPGHNFTLQSIIAFDYWEDRNGNLTIDNTTRKQCRIHINWNLHLLPYSEWLGVDYGSSAIVCRYDNDVVDLKSEKVEVFRQTAFNEDSLEKGTSFLSSDIVLHTNDVKDRSSLLSELPEKPENYLDLAVCLSPTSSLLRTDFQNQLPCLKILVGNEFLPDNANYNTFEYNRLKDNILSRVRANTVTREDSCLLRVSSIFKESYANLFRYFIKPTTQDRRINKLVLTYPNTYTPVHLNVLEKIAKQTFPNVRSGYLKFVSESDAVAAYYISNWYNYNPNGNFNKDETVLVYDMGAGTLDLTLFTKTENLQTGKTEVKILGKIGTGKAGNYLDFLLAKILKDIFPNITKNNAIISTNNINDNNLRRERFDLKYLIKNTIKPNLKVGKKVDFRHNNSDFKLDCNDVLNHELFKNYIKEVTSSIVNLLLAYVGNAGLEIDTILMSGRSCRLEALKSGLTTSFENVPRLVTLGEHEKTAVVEGAMTQADLYSSPDSQVKILSRRLYASYGLVYDILGGRKKYVELLNSAKLEFSDNNRNLGNLEGDNIIVEGTGATAKIKLIQTYLSPEDTEEACNVGNFEFISEMEEYDMNQFNHANLLNVRLRCDYRNNISCFINGGVGHGKSPQGVDLASSITKQSIWPVTI